MGFVARVCQPSTLRMLIWRVADGVIRNDWIGPGAAIAVLDQEQAAISMRRGGDFRPGLDWRRPPDRPALPSPASFLSAVVLPALVGRGTQAVYSVTVIAV
jgi:hypothetical protein